MTWGLWQPKRTLEEGGIRPPPRRRSPQALTLSEREEISRGLVNGHSLRRIAYGLGRAPSTVSREVARNGGPERYRAAASDRQAWRRALRPKPCKWVTHPPLQQLVEARLVHNWSPQQIAGWLKRTYPEDEAFWVSHETIYRTLYVQTRGALKKELTAHLRTHRPIRRSRHVAAKADLRGRIPDTVSISERPANADDRAVPGHWNDDRFGSLADLATQPRPAKAGDAPAGSALLARVYSRADRMSKVTEQCLCRGRALTPTQL